MGLFDLFSNDTAEEAARQRNQGLQQGYDALSSTYGQGRDALSSNYAQGGSALTSALGQGRDAITSAYGQGRDALNSNYGQAAGLYRGLLDSYTPGANAYGDAAGANGAEGLARATANFKNSGQYGVYGVGLNEGLQALSRARAAAGNLSSGNADTEAIKYAQDQASKAYGQYAAGLAPYLQGQGTATQGLAGLYSGLGQNINQSYDAQGNAIGSSYGAQGAGLNANYGALGQGLNTSYQGQGGAANANYTGQGASNAAATMNNYNVGANQLGALMGVANLAAGGIGGAGGLGGLTGGFGGQGFSLGPTSVGGSPVSGGLFSMFK